MKNMKNYKTQLGLILIGLIIIVIGYVSLTKENKDIVYSHEYSLYFPLSIEGNAELCGYEVISQYPLTNREIKEAGIKTSELITQFCVKNNISYSDFQEIFHPESSTEVFLYAEKGEYMDKLNSFLRKEFNKKIKFTVFKIGT